MQVWVTLFWLNDVLDTWHLSQLVAQLRVYRLALRRYFNKTYPTYLIVQFIRGLDLKNRPLLLRHPLTN